MKKKITNDEFNTAYIDINNKKIINKVAQKYKKYIPRDEIKTCGMMALWKSLEKFNPERGRKFTSFLYNMMNFECMAWLNKDSKYKQKINKYLQSPFNFISDSINCNSYNEFNDLISILPKNLATIVELRIIYNMSFEEIGVINKFSHETARRKLKEAYDKLKNEYPTMSH